MQCNFRMHIFKFIYPLITIGYKIKILKQFLSYIQRCKTTSLHWKHLEFLPINNNSILPSKESKSWREREPYLKVTQQLKILAPSLKFVESNSLIQKRKLIQLYCHVILLVKKKKSHLDKKRR